MKTVLKSWVAQGFALMMAASVAFAQDRAPFPQQALDQMLAPVALYPDPLLAQVLMASTYPLDVVQAARWSRANPGLKGQDAERAVEPFDWDPSVKSLAALPQVLAMMDANLDWMERLGEAFIVQQAQVMDTVQGLRRRAEAAGNLRSSDEMQVAREGEVITLAPPAPGIVYVPYYDPTVVYGSWWWPAHPPAYWAPPPANYGVPAHRPGFLWGSGIVISAGFFFGHADWHHRHVTVVRHRATVVHGPAAGTRAAWRHNPAHRRGVPLRHGGAQGRFEQRSATPTQAAVAPRVSDPPAAEARQRQMNERRKAADQRREAAPQRAASTGRNERRSVDREAGRPRPVARSEAPRPQARAAVERPAAVAPAARPVARPPVHRADTRAAPQTRPTTGPARAARRDAMN